MAISIHTSPELTGRTAELFVQEADSRKATRPPLSEEKKKLLRQAEEKSRNMRAKLLSTYPNEA